MNRFVWMCGAIFLATGCIGVVDNSGMVNDEDDGGAGGGTGIGSGPANPGRGDVSAGSGGSGILTGGSVQGTGGSASGSNGFGGSSGSSVTNTVGSGGATSSGTGSIAPGATGGAFGGSGGAPADAGAAGGRADGGIVLPDAGRDSGIVAGATFAQVKTIIQQRCMSCHRGFETYATLTTHTVGRCGGDKLATANDPANSAFLELVQGQGCGGFLMPRGCSSSPCLSATEIQTFTSWINAGAPNN